ncbi:MAG: helix-turn-helix transcriptional regulator [Planctomycetes bacterium]|nr:helix-turn-helix transcriptional regulator [Planctomycetota bacterium]
MPQVCCAFAFVTDITANYVCPEHEHHSTEIVYNIGCAGTLHQNSNILHYAPHTVFVYQPGCTHHVHNHIAGQQICIGVVGSGAEKISSDVFASNEHLDQLFLMIIKCLEHGGEQQQKQLDLLAGLVALDLQSSIAPDNQSYAYQAKQFVEEHIAEPLSIDRIAEHIFISPDYLRSLFKKEFGTSIMHHVIQRRLEFACALLCNSKKTVKEIALQCGFQSPYYFSRMFKKRMHMTPTEYRSSHKL